MEKRRFSLTKNIFVMEEKENEENIFVEEEKKNVWIRKISFLWRRRSKSKKIFKDGNYIFCGGEVKWRRKQKKIVGEGKYLFFL